MTAKEMFEELGFKKATGYTGIMYKKESYERINFFGTMKEMEKITYVHFVNNTVEVTKSLFIGAGNSEEIDMKMLKAINKQVEELGWLDKKDKE